MSSSRRADLYADYLLGTVGPRLSAKSLRHIHHFFFRHRNKTQVFLAFQYSYRVVFNFSSTAAGAEKPLQAAAALRQDVVTDTPHELL